MTQWFYEMYGFYPLQMNRGVFYMNQTKYELIPVVDDEPWGEYEAMLSQVCQINSLGRIVIVKNRQNQYVSSYQNIPYILVAGSDYAISLPHIWSMHFRTRRKQPLNLFDMKVKWITRVDQMEYEILPWLPPTTPQFDQLVVATYVALGLAENAITYLSSIPASSLMTCLCNKRMEDMSSWVILNPARVLYDHPSRDIAELVKMNVISDQDLFTLIEELKMNEVELSYLVARLLFPFQLFDGIEALYTEQRSNICVDMLEFESSVRRILHLVKQLLIRFSLRPIEWILAG